MKNIYLIIGVLILITLAVGGFLLFKKSQNGKPLNIGIETQVSEEVEFVDNDQYLEYSKEVVESSVSTRRVLFFYANWCETCRPADAEFNAKVSELPTDVTLIRVNYNDTDTDSEEKELASKYGITYQHTFVLIDGDETEVSKWNGGKMEELLKNLSGS